MPTSKNHRRGTEEKNRKGKISEKSSSFHGERPTTTISQLRRPKTLPDLLLNRNYVGATPPEERPKLTKLLLNVTIQGSLGPVHVLMSPEWKVADLVAEAVRQYVKECRRPILPTTDPADFDLHYSQFSLESLDKEDKLLTLGSRNFFLCRKKLVIDGGNSCGGGGFGVSNSSSCSKQAEKATKPGGFNWFKFMDFSL